MRNHAHPAQFAYEIGDKFIKMDEFDGIDSYKETLSEQLRKEIEAEYKAKYEKKSKKAKDIPSSITDAANTSENEGKVALVDVDSFIKSQGWLK